MASDLHTPRPVRPLRQPPDSSVRVPGSKSHTNRALICAALASGASRLEGTLFADDTEAMVGALSDLGVGVAVDVEHAAISVQGTGGVLPPGPARLDVRQSGTTSRFVLPLLALGSGTYVLDGHEQLRARPFEDLVAALSQLGVQTSGSVLPITVHGGSFRGGTVQIPGSVSSQFLSGLLLSAPCAERPVVIEVVGELVSRPYVELTLSTMRSFGARIDHDEGLDRFVVHPTGYRAADVVIEPDASAASYFFGAAAISGGRIRVPGLGRDTVQGDLRFVDVLEAMGAEVVRGADSTEVLGAGALHGIDVDMTDISDTAQTLAVVATFADSVTRITGIGFIRRKETDRIGAVVRELTRLGIRAEEEVDGMTIHPGVPRAGVVATYDDHRMAMSFALLGLVHPGIEIADPGCVSKTFPRFFETLDQLN
ncbi:MAG: 3-phosphoshikimate 1-carboxyvinyltransferase [Actinomycetota bacterium]|nr:3-phosphoshikimate 1-carboxyvinyltransferase [Actinomycetota bacterium]